MTSTVLKRRRLRLPRRAGAIEIVLCTLGAGAIVAVQFANLPDLLDTAQPLTAGFAKALVLFYGLGVVAIVGAAAILPLPRLGWPVAIAAGLAAVPVVVTLTVGGELWSLVVALLTMAACWRLGAWLLTALRSPALAQSPPVAWLAGVAVLGLLTLLLGRLHALRWWTLGLLVIALGVLGAWSLGRDFARGGARSAWRTVTSNRLAAGCAAVGLLLLGLASVWTAAPDLMFDSLYAKAWLPREWADTGRITAFTIHPVLNNAGFSQLIAVAGDLVGADAIGRYLQWLAAAAVVSTVWWAARASRWAPLAAATVAVTPQLFWQATTAFDDALLVLGAAAMALAVLIALEDRRADPFWTGLAFGVLAGAVVDLKIHLGLLAAGLAAGWLLAAGAPRLIRAAGLVAGGLASAAIPIVLRWIDTGNPVLPAYNNIFKSPYWPPVNETLGMPFFTPGHWGPLEVVVRSATDSLALNEAAPNGSFGFLMAAIVVGLVLAWRPSAGPGPRALWLAVLLAALAWYTEFRYLRYLLPAGVVAVIAVALLDRRGSPPLSGRAQRWGLVWLVGGAVLLWPATVAQFWNVPGRDIPWEVAIHRTSDRTYEDQAMPEREGLAAFSRVAPKGSMAVSDAHERMWVTQGHDLSPVWEIAARLQATGTIPTTPDAALRRLRGLGVEWAFLSVGGTGEQQNYMRLVLPTHGEVA